MRIIKQHSSAIFYSNFQNDREIVLEVIHKHPYAMMKNFRNDKEMGLIVASNQDYFSFKDFGEDLKKDKDVIMRSIQNYPFKTLKYALYQDEDIVREAVTRDFSTMQFVKPELQTKELVLTAVKLNACSIFFVRKEFRQDAEIMIEIIHQNLWDFVAEKYCFQ